MEHSHEGKCEGDCRYGNGGCGSCGGGACRCGGYSWGHGFPAHHILRWVLAIAILAIVFKVGVAVGEFKTELRDFSGGKGFIRYRSMMPEEMHDDQNYFFYRRGPMRGSMLDSVSTTTER